MSKRNKSGSRDPSQEREQRTINFQDNIEQVENSQESHSLEDNNGQSEVDKIPTMSEGQAKVMKNVQVGTLARESSSDDYDRDEPLTTRAIKVYRRKHKLANPAPEDSEDSFEASNTLVSLYRRSATRTRGSQIMYNPISGTEWGQQTESGFQAFTSSESMKQSDPADPSRDLTQRNLPPGFKLASGNAFIYMSIPPDGGYGWVVLLLSFLAQLIVDGIVFSIGILLPFIATEFHVSSAKVVLVGSIQIGCYFLGGAFSSILINSYGFRPVAIVGVVISAVGILAASFSPNLLTMIICYSIIGGPALSMIWVSSQLIIGFYFERYRAIASGFSCSGAGAGIFIFSIANGMLESRLGWRNTIRVQVALILLIFFVALAYLEVAPIPVAVVIHDPTDSSSSNEYYGNFYVHNFLGDDLSSKKSHPVLEDYEPPVKRPGRWRRCFNRCTSCLGRRSSKSEPQYPKTEEVPQERNYVVRADPIQREDLFYTGPTEYSEPHTKEQFDGKDLELVGSQAHIQSAAYGLHNIHEYETSDDEAVPAAPNLPSTQDPKSPQPSTPTHVHRHKKHRKQQKRHWLKKRIGKAMLRLFDVHLFKSFEFRILVASAFLYPMGFNIPFVYSKARTTIPAEYAQWIAPSIGATSFLVRILCGFVAYKLRTWTNEICGGGMILGGTMVFISAFYGTNLVWFQFLYGLLYGVAPAVFATLRAIIYVRYLGLLKLTNAFGITALAMGLGVFLGTTFGGFLVHCTGGYVAPFVFAGLCITLAGVLKLILPALIKYRANRRAF